MKKGFTLIEMLIVIAIIAILSSVFLVGLRGFRQSAMDSRRLADLQHTQSYLEVYYTKYRCYPGGNTNGTSVPCPTVGTSNGSNDYKTMTNSLIASNSTTAVPDDPANGGTYYYGVSSDGQSYVLGANLSPGNSAYNEQSFTQLLTQQGQNGGTTYGITCSNGSAATALFCIKF